jgi:hypothetical protein
VGALAPGGIAGWLGPRVNIPGSEGFLSEEVTNVEPDAPTTLAKGEVVRISANDAVRRAQADSAPNAQGTIGVTGAVILPGQKGPVVTEGKTTVLLETGLVGVLAGQTLWLSPNEDGRATNVKPTGTSDPPDVELCIGIIKDASGISVPTVAGNSVITDVDVDCEPAIAGLVASIQCGKEPLGDQRTPPVAAQTTQAVVFPVPFVSPPSVVLTPLDEANVTVTANLDAAPTTAGFTIRMSAAYNGFVHWIACTD